MSQAITDLIHELFIKNRIHFDILMYGNLTCNSLDLINMIEMKNDGNFAEKVRKIEPELWDHKIYKSAVIFTKNMNTVNHLVLNATLDSPFPHRISFLMYCEDLNETSLAKLYVPFNLNPDEGMISIYQYFLNNNKTSIDLLTIEWYTEKDCSNDQIVMVNSFNKKSKSWNKNLVIEEKFKQFHGCMLTVGLRPSYMMTNIYRFGSQPFGPIVDLFKAMAYVGNFTYNYQLYLYLPDENNKLVKENIPKDGTVIEPNAAFQIAVLKSSPLLYKEIHFLTSFHEEKVSFLIAPSEPYDSYEKLLFPFDFWTWIYLLVIFECSFLSILIINWLPVKIQDLVYGENVMTPALNVGAIFFGMSQTQVPFKSFPRIILITFIFFCLVMRTAYQGVLFEMIAADIRKPPPRTIAELFANNYSIYSINILQDSITSLLTKEERYESEI
ncbi:unnamed protein product [Chironomus riparius]|uniref:Ionotropic receptor n=1 Tax=Chironomus riparius TaxID=315576 RepID=A0A9N9S270_9DIPT|nr:unnamed protein product [Chironomus riparius]